MNSPAEIPAHEFRLFVREGRPRFYFKNNNEGVWLSERGIGWFLDGVSHTREWRELSMVHLEVHYVPKHGSFGSCVLHFSSGQILTVLSAGKWGGVDGEKNQEYGRFLTRLHQMIPASERERVRFESGISGVRHVILKVTIFVAAAFFVLVPLGIAIFLRKLEALFITAAGAAFVWPLMRMIKASKPSSYDPNAVPEHLFP